MDQMTVSVDDDTDPLETSIETLHEQHERDLRRVYQLGVLHGINVQSMAQVTNDVMTFDDYGWTLDGDGDD